MNTLFLLIYLGILFVAFVVAGFIVYHMLSYSLHRTLSLVGIGIFISVFLILTILNLLSFFTIDFSATRVSLPSTSSSSTFVPTKSNPW